MPNNYLTVGRLTNMFGRAFYGIREQNKSRGSFNRIDWMNQFSYLRPTMVFRYSPGTTKLFNGTSSGMGALGSTNAPVLTSGIFGVLGEEGLVVNTTLAKCVGTATFGGEPMTSWVCCKTQSSGSITRHREKYLQHAIYHQDPASGDKVGS